LEDFEGEKEEKPKLFLPKIGRASELDLVL